MIGRIAVLLAIVVVPTHVRADNWPAWRGANGDGHCGETNLPVHWSATENVRWKIALPGPGNSTPVIWGNRIFITQSLDEQGHERALLCIDRRNGKILWRKVTRFEGMESTHADNPYCSASPVTDGERVIASFGSSGVFCYSINGKELWHRDLGKFEHIWGNASSPVIYKNLVILNCGPGERTFLIALNKQDGKDVWKVDEPGGMYGHAPADWIGSWSTPIVATINGRTELIMSWPNAVKSYNPRTGKLLWTCNGLSRLIYTSPLVTPDVIVSMSGYGGSYLALRTGGDGDVTDSHRMWLVDRAPQRIGSGVIIGNHIYIANEPGTAECIELKTGKTLWTERLGGSSWGSMVAAGDKLYITNLQGETFVLAAKPAFEVIGRNHLNERTLASIAVSNGEFFIRTYEHLWCISGKG